MGYLRDEGYFQDLGDFGLLKELGDVGDLGGLVIKEI